MTWRSVPICMRCWVEQEKDRTPVRLSSRDVVERCYNCDAPTADGIYVRRDVAAENKQT